MIFLILQIFRFMGCSYVSHVSHVPDQTNHPSFLLCPNQITTQKREQERDRVVILRLSRFSPSRRHGKFYTVTKDKQLSRKKKKDRTNKG